MKRQDIYVAHEANIHDHFNDQNYVAEIADPFSDQLLWTCSERSKIWDRQLKNISSVTNDKSFPLL